MSRVGVNGSLHQQRQLLHIQLKRDILQGLLLLSFLFALGQPAVALDNGLARKPHMGYSTWNAFHDEISEAHIREATDLMQQLGFQQAGYQYINIDDGWSERLPRAPGPIRANRTRFPNGMKAVADYVHSKGFKLGIYSDTGFQTCAQYVASGGYEMEDARQFADWEVDLLKYDNCWTKPDMPDVYKRYSAMRDALNATGRPILYSMCEWGASAPWRYGASMANSWRTTKDISIEIVGTWDGIVHNLMNNLYLAKYAGPGGWNDADMLLVGLPGSQKISLNEQQAHFALWAIMKSPLVIGADMRLMTKEQVAILTNREVIAINQDPLGVAGDLIWKEGADEIYAAPLVNGSRAVVMLNRRQGGSGDDRVYESMSLTVKWDQLGYPTNLLVRVRDLHARKDLGTYMNNVTLVIGAQISRAITLTPLKGRLLDRSSRHHHHGLGSKNSSSGDHLHRPHRCVVLGVAVQEGPCPCALSAGLF
eukprot:jgi/Botrbrau1/3410/Bobra.0337s0043.4